MGFDYSRSGLVVETIVMMALGLVSTVFRFWSRAVVHRRDFRLDDWLALAAMLVLQGQFIVGLINVHLGAGKDLETLSLHSVDLIYRCCFASIIINAVGLALAKLSQLAFYHRIFGFGHSGVLWKISQCVAVFLVIAEPLWAVPTEIWMCQPVDEFWKYLQGPPGNCLNTDAITIAAAAQNAFVDLLILLQPLPQLYSLHMSKSKKWKLGAAFVIGYSVVIVSLGKLAVTIYFFDHSEVNLPHILVPLGYWLQAEAGIILFAISVMPIYQLHKRFSRFGLGSLFTSHLYFLQDDVVPRGEDSVTSIGRRKNRLGFNGKGIKSLPSSDGEDGVYLSTRNELNTIGTGAENTATAEAATPPLSREAIEGPLRGDIHVCQRYQVTYEA